MIEWIYTLQVLISSWLLTYIQSPFEEVKKEQFMRKWTNPLMWRNWDGIFPPWVAKPRKWKKNFPLEPWMTNGENYPSPFLHIKGFTFPYWERKFHHQGWKRSFLPSVMAPRVEKIFSTLGANLELEFSTPGDH